MTYVQDDGRVTSSATRTPMPTVLCDPLPAFEPALWVRASHEAAWATSQVQGFLYRGEGRTFAAVVRDCLRPPAEQVLFRHDFEADLVDAGGYPVPCAAYEDANARMTLFIQTHGVAIVAEHYRRLRREHLARGGL